jgi:hypothetical protein
MLKIKNCQELKSCAQSWKEISLNSIKNYIIYIKESYRDDNYWVIYKTTSKKINISLKVIGFTIFVASK